MRARLSTVWVCPDGHVKTLPDPNSRRRVFCMAVFDRQDGEQLCGLRMLFRWHVDTTTTTKELPV